MTSNRAQERTVLSISTLRTGRRVTAQHASVSMEPPRVKPSAAPLSPAHHRLEMRANAALVVQVG